MEIEILKSGKSFDDSDLLEIVDNFNILKDKIKPMLKLNTRADGQPSLGWVTSLKKVGNKLIATFNDIAPIASRVLSEKKYKQIKASLYDILDVGGQKFRNVLASVNITSDTIPTVRDMDGLAAFFSEDNNNIVSYSFNTHMGVIGKENDMNGVKLDKKATQYARDHKISYFDAAQEVLTENLDLALSFCEPVLDDVLNNTTNFKENDMNGVKLDKKVTQYARDHKISYFDAAQEVLMEDLDLALSFCEPVLDDVLDNTNFMDINNGLEMHEKVLKYMREHNTINYYEACENVLSSAGRP